MAASDTTETPQRSVMRCGDRLLDLSKPGVMGILNMTPDSFSDGGLMLRGSVPQMDRVLRTAERMQRAGAAIVDIGGESTRPGAAPVSEQEEIDRVAPVIAAIAARVDIILSVDTSNASLMREAARLGAGMINDVRALQREGALQAARESGLAVCLMHMQGEPGVMQREPHYTDVVAEVCRFLASRVMQCREAGLCSDRLLVDPGFGFGKTVQHNLSLFRALPELVALGYPVLIGVSRKSMIGQVLGRPIMARLAGGLALATLGAEAGVRVVRTHDVQATCDALAMVAAIRGEWRG